MIGLLLYAYSDNEHLIPIFWGVGFLIAALLIYGIFRQRRIGVRLNKELQELEKTRQNNIEYEFILKAMKIAVWRMDPKMRLVTYESDYRDGKDSYVSSPDTPIDSMWDYLESSDMQRVKVALEDILAGRSDSYHQTYRVKLNNSMYWEESYATISARDENGNPTSIVGTSLRIDEQKKMETDLINARNKAEESDRLKTAFLANMSHEIRTPLNAIVGFTSLLPDLQNAEERQSILDLIQENTQKLLRIVDDVVSISKVEAGKEELMLTTFDLPIMLKAVVDQYMPQLNKGVTMTTSFPQSSLSITSDRNRMQETMRHLVSNAVKFTDRGEVIVGFDTPVKGKIKLWVRDTGKGIAPEYHERIFERFFKVDEFIPGAGLGLTTCRTMAYSMGGNVKVDSQLGQGATFTFEVPFADVDAIPGKSEYE